MYEALGLASVRVSDPGTSPWSFEWLRREITEPPAYATRAATWLFGERNGVAVVVRPMTLPGDAPYVGVVAEIDPPLFGGLRMFSRSLAEAFRFSSIVPLFQVPALDHAFVIRFHDRDRVARLLGVTGTDDGFARDLVGAGTRRDLVIDDRSVQTLIFGERPSEGIIEADIQLVTALARRFAERGRTLPERSNEQAARESWAEVAGAWSVVFDAPRWKISGENEGRRIDVLLDGVPPGVSTVCRVSFRLPLGAGLFLRSGLRLRRNVSSSGHRDLDELLLFDARDRERALAAIADPTVRQLLLGEARHANVAMTDRGITSARGGFVGGAELSARIAALASIVDRVTPALHLAGPFR